MMVWGGNFAVMKTAIEYVPPFSLLALRYAVVALVLVPFIKVPRAHLKQIFIYAFLMGGLHFGFIMTGLRYVDAATVALLTQVGVPFSTILAAIIFKDYPGWRRWLGIALAFVGAAVIAGEPRFEGDILWVGMVVFAALVWAVGNTQVKAMSGVDGLALNGWMALFATPMLAVWSLLFEEGQVDAYVSAGWIGGAALFYQSAMVTLFGYGCWFWLMKKYPISLLMPFTLLGPTFGVAAGVLFLAEPVTVNMIIGGLMTLGGVGIIVLRRPSLLADTKRYKAEP
ncbi:DMT family transporter [Hwanghaeella grinnelliae]|uniref:DMT family transporter n=2 Tax=Hwanghaeella grinnelliae TaxID=2500179 RepID=A0A437QGY6_9PROT|nr:DMT family transporter [Hwanghaeella grinnelliae]